jgi:hypothetical protein
MYGLALSTRIKNLMTASFPSFSADSGKDLGSASF